ncbi:MAG: M48 family metalloprotease [Pseudomonadota bacterium]
MALDTDSNGFWSVAEKVIASATQFTQGLFGHSDFSPEEALIRTPGIDPRFIPRGPMNADNIDVSTLNELGRMGMKRGKRITAQSHPELYQAWQVLSARAGLKQAPQLILAESKTVNAVTLSPEEVVVTTSLLKLLNFRELNAVLGHELGHEASDHTRPRIVAMSVFGGAGLVIGNDIAHHGGIRWMIDAAKENPGRFKKMLLSAFGDGTRPYSLLGSVAAVAIGAGIGGIVANKVSVRPTELDADRKGALISGDPLGLISALNKLDESRGEKTLYQRFRAFKSGYPSHEARIENLRALAATMPSSSVVISDDEAIAPLTPGAPAAQIHQVAHIERVGTPVQVQGVTG